MSGDSKNPQEDLLNWLKENAPEVFTEGKIDCIRLKKTLGEAVAEENERYGLSWAGKSNCFRTIQEPTTATLQPMRDESVNFDETENIFIEGDNLEVLKVLQKPYYGKVKMIYIDPPYNTGNDFIYNDDFKKSRAEYLEEAGETDENGNMRSDGLMKNSKDRGHYHSDWLNMMYPRLFLARNLLKDDGVIFVSIDDNEVKNLRAIMDEIFGEENFLTNLVWKRRQNADSRNLTNASVDHEYILVYSRDLLSSSFKGKGIDESKYTNPDNDSRGPWASIDLSGLATKEQRPNLHYELVDPATGISYPPNPKRGWSKSKSVMEKMIEEGRILFPKNSTGRPREKKFLYDLQRLTTGFSSILASEMVGYTTNGTREVSEIFGTKVFDFPKPTSLIKTLVNQQAQDDDIILDFFAGSGTTAHAVMALNAEDGGNRKCISIQLPELCDEKSEAYKAGFKTIAEISKERIRRAGKQIVKEKGDQLNLNGSKLDTGFKAFKLQGSNFKIWESQVKNAEKLAKQMDIFVNNNKGKTDQEAVLYELVVKSGLNLNSKVENKDKFYSINNGELVLCLAETLDKTIVERILAEKPAKVLCLDSSFNGNDQLKTNTALQMETAGIELRVI